MSTGVLTVKVSRFQIYFRLRPIGLSDELGGARVGDKGD